MKVYITENLDPWMNLAIENWLYSRKDLENQEIIFLYRNSSSVIIGRFQNPWLECDLQKMTENNVSFVRRQSGGGAVYHDPGNTNFTFISDRQNFIKEEKTDLIISSIKSLGIEAYHGNRNDIYVQEKKISGSASRYSSSRVLHHGTLLINADLYALNKYLITMDYNSGSILSKGIASIPSKVVNLQEFDKTLNHERICEAIISETSKTSDKQIDITNLTLSDLDNIQEIRDYYSIITDWNWLYGKTPSFTLAAPIQLGKAEVDCLFTINKGIIKNISYNRSFSDLENRSIIDHSFIGKRCDTIMQMINNERY